MKNPDDVLIVESYKTEAVDAIKIKAKTFEHIGEVQARDEGWAASQCQMDVVKSTAEMAAFDEIRKSAAKIDGHVVILKDRSSIGGVTVGIDFIADVYKLKQFPECKECSGKEMKVANVGAWHKGEYPATVPVPFDYCKETRLRCKKCLVAFGLNDGFTR